MQDYDRIRDRETNRYLDRLFSEPEDADPDWQREQMLELPEDLRGADAVNMYDLQETTRETR